MKRLIALLLVVVMVISLAACGDNGTTGDKNNTTASTNENINADNTEITIETVKNAKETDASLFEYEEVDGGVSITGFNGTEKIVVIPSNIGDKTVLSISDNAFINNSTMLGLRLSGSVLQIGSHAFENCVSLEIFVAGSSLENIKEFAFNGCLALNKVELNEGLKSLEMLCFGATDISELYIPMSVETIDVPFTKKEEKTLKIISQVGSEAEKYVDMDGESFNIVFEAK